MNIAVKPWENDVMNLRQLFAGAMIMAICAFGVAASAWQPAVGQAKTVTINEDEKTTTIDCKGDVVTVSGDDNKVTLKGDCSRLTVSGDDNTVDAAIVTEVAISGDDNKIEVETVAKISISGDDNNVKWTKGLSGKPPEISNTGEDNTVAASK